MSIEARVQWVDERRFLGQATSGHGIVVDASPQKLGPSPMELLLIGLAGCTAYDVIDILQKKRQTITALEVVATAERQEEHPRVYTAIDLEYVIRGRDVKAKAVEDAIRLSEERYCSASAMLGRTARLTSRYRIEPDPDGNA